MMGTPSNSYAEAKIEIEESLDKWASQNEVNLTHARLFAFAGPYISLTDHFAVGNFIRNVIEGTRIDVKGNPKTMRSYMYPTDLASSLVRLMSAQGLSHINIGSPAAVTMEELASTCSKLGQNLPIRFSGKNQIQTSYVPETRLLIESLKISNPVVLEEGLKRWIDWLKIRTSSN
jgi:dTDP-glucose 4,6-dehydratase